MPIRSPVRSPIYSPIWGATGSRYGNGADALLAAMGLAGAENVAAFDFATSTGRIKDTTTPANNWSGALADKLTYSGSTKYRRNGAGVLVPATGILPEYDIAGANIGYRSEQQDVNRLLWSSDLSNAAWSRISMPTAPTAADDPAGGMTAWTLTDDQAGDISYISQTNLRFTPIASESSQCSSFIFIALAGRISCHYGGNCLELPVILPPFPTKLPAY